MKKLLLSMAAVALTASASWASETTLVFDGENDMAGLTRQTTTNPTDVVKEIAYSQDGVDFRLEVTDGTGKGYALVNAGGTNAGIYVSSSVGSQVTITVPNGHVTGAKLLMSGYALSTLDVTFNGKEIEGNSEGSLYSWIWGDAEGGENLTLSWPSTFMARYIHSIEVTYTADLGGKEECGLAFSTATAEGIVGETFTAPELSNPHDLPLSWSSSDESVATVDEDGKVTLVGGGTAVIEASTEGDDSYARGNARYTLTVMPAAANIAQLYADAPEQNDLVKVNFPMIVTYATKSNAYVKDEEGNATLIHNIKNDGNTGASADIYKVGDIIPAGWVATNDGVNGFKGLPEEVTETTTVVYPEVESISYEADANKVVTLMDVTFETSTNAKDKTYGTTPDGTTYEFQNTFEIADSPAGTYNATVVVKYNKIRNTVYSWLAPIEFAKDPVFPETFEVEVSSETLIIEKEEEEGGHRIIVGGSCAEDTATVEVIVPEGWDGFIGMSDSDYSEDIEYSKLSAKRKAAAEAEWAPIETMLAYGFKKTNSFVFPVDGEEHSGKLYLYKGEKVDMANEISVDFQAEKTTVEVKPEFPKEFVVTVSDENLTVSQEAIDVDYHQITIEGESDKETVTVELEVPEGWDGYYSLSSNDYEPDFGGMKRARAIAEDAEDDGMWMPVSELPEMMKGIKEGNSLIFNVGEENQNGMFFLFKGEMAYMAQIYMEVNVTKAETPEPAPEFPKEFVVTVSDENLTVSQEVIDVDYHQITI
ncbi:MAG: hypothetical protein K2H76_08200, partial [Muribaculaceae bacterium]|nr:hypothetical protein [Muribaculaceae bacterium]